MNFPYHHQQQQPQSLPQYAGQDSHHHHHHHHHQVVLPPSQSGGSSSHQYSSSNNHHLVAAQQRQQQQQQQNNNNSNNKNSIDQLQQLAELANKMIHKIDTSMMLNPYKEDKKLQMEAEANIQDNLLKYALPFLKMFLHCHGEYVKTAAASSPGNSFFNFASEIDIRLNKMNQNNNTVYEYSEQLNSFYRTTDPAFSSKTRFLKLRNRECGSGFITALYGRAFFILDEALRWKSTQLFLLPTQFLEKFLENEASFIEQYFSNKRGYDNTQYDEEKDGSIFSKEDRDRIEKVIESKNNLNFDVVKQLFRLVCTNKSVGDGSEHQQHHLPLNFIRFFLLLIKSFVNHLDPTPLRTYYIETTSIPFDENLHKAQLDPQKNIPEFSFHNHLQSTFNLIDGIFLLIESSISCLSKERYLTHIILDICFTLLISFSKFCVAPIVSKNLLLVADDPRAHQDPRLSYSSSSSSSSSTLYHNSNSNIRQIPTKNRLLQLAHYLQYFVSQIVDEQNACLNGSRFAYKCFRAFCLILELCWFNVNTCCKGSFRKNIDVETLLSVGVESRETITHQSPRLLSSDGSPSIQTFYYSFTEVVDWINFQCVNDNVLNGLFSRGDIRFNCRSLTGIICRSRNAMTLKKALSSASKDVDDEEEANGEINIDQEALFKNMRNDFDSELANASSSSQDANEDDSSSNNNNHPPPPVPLPPSDDDHKIDRITPASPSSQQPQQNLPAVNLPAPAVRSQQATPVFGTSLHLYISKQLLLKFSRFSGVFATSNHFMVLYDKYINDRKTKINVSRELYLNEYKALKCIFYHYRCMNAAEQNRFKDLLKDCHDDSNAHRDEIDRDFDKKYHRNHVKHNPDCSLRENYNYFETTPPSILKKVSNYNNIQQDPTKILHPDGTFRFKKDFSFFDQTLNKVNNNNNKRCRWKKVVAADFAGETDVAFGRWIEQRCRAPDISLLDYADSPGFMFEEKLDSESWRHVKKRPIANNNNNAAQAHQQYYGSSTLGVHAHHVNNNKSNNNNKQTNEMMSGHRRERDNNNNQTNKNNNMMMMSGKRRVEEMNKW